MIEVDDSPIVVTALRLDQRVRPVARHLDFEVTFDPQEGIYTATGDFHMMVSAETRTELEAAVDDALAFLWREYLISGETFSDDAKLLRNQLIEAFGGSRCRLNDRAALEKKRFVRAQGDYRFFTYYTIRGSKTSVWTKTSHGTGYKTIGDRLVGEMARQCGLTSPQFKQLIACPLDRDELESILLTNGRISEVREVVIDRAGGRKTVYDSTGHLRQFKESGDKKDAKISRETWSDETSARKAFSKGSVTWMNDT